MSSLCEIGEQYNTDKVSHGYISHYERRFGGNRGKPITILEIGVMDGASLRMWRDYFSFGRVYGIDIRHKTIISEDRIVCFEGSQVDTNFLENVVKQTGNFDFIVDDGSHKGSHHLASFEYLWSFVKPEGWYCIEDASSIFNTCWTQPEQRTMLSFIQEQWADILRSKSDIAEVSIVGCDTRKPKNGRNNGLIFLQKAVESGEQDEETREDESYFFK